MFEELHYFAVQLSDRWPYNPEYYNAWRDAEAGRIRATQGEFTRADMELRIQLREKFRTHLRDFFYTLIGAI